MKRTMILLRLGSAIVLLVILLLLLGVAMRRGVNHDEYQFIASGKLLATTHLAPYRDFPYFHVPGLSLIYAGLFYISSHLLLTARLFSVLCAWLLLALLWRMTLVELRHERAGLRMAAGVGMMLLLSATPIFLYTSGRAWNHDLPMLLTVIAFWLLIQQPLKAEQGGSKTASLLAKPDLSESGRVGLIHRSRLIGAGFLVGLALATRLSFAFAFFGFSLPLLIQPASSWAAQWHKVKNFMLGGLLGATPALLFLLWSPQAFLFGNLTYIKLNTQYYQTAATLPDAMTVLGKLRFICQLFWHEPTNGAPFLCLAIGIFLYRQSQLRFWTAWRWQLLALVWLSMFISGLIATPSQPQYFYSLWPLLLLGLALLLGDASQQPDRRRFAWFILLLLGAGLMTLSLNFSLYRDGLEIVFSPREWYPTKLHARGRWVRTLVNTGEGKPGAVLTVAPIIPLEGDIDIYPELATGPFAWRVAPLLPTAARRRYHLFTPDELIAQLTLAPPRALLVGLENDDADLEAVLVAWAQAQGYLPIALPDEGTLWVSALAEWGNAIRLGAHTLPQEGLQPGATAEIVFYLQNIQPLTVNLNILVRLVDKDGQEIWRDEGWPWGAATTNWSPGEVWPDGHTLTVPADAPPGCYGVEVGFYNPETFEAVGHAQHVGRLWIGDQPQSDNRCG